MYKLYEITERCKWNTDGSVNKEGLGQWVKGFKSISSLDLNFYSNLSQNLGKNPFWLGASPIIKPQIYPNICIFLFLMAKWFIGRVLGSIRTLGALRDGLLLAWESGVQDYCLGNSGRA
ncbi:hypothetical protein RHMOL_Rhmol09G0049600 [Rhododendron molle]|uniref:Uncharacterized protein n=1 Tax=Rhododendron molle TaxID=49168 RepID=A0ACC0MB81_RHOML|nr:hypothetical protein RHMOL_Rhmol09G0049600 [Rhododendron molle]